MTTRTLSLNNTRWRLLNHLANADGTQVRATTLLDTQDGSTDDLRWLGESQLVYTSLVGRLTPRLDLVEHLTHHGSTVVLGLKLNHRGRGVVEQPQNRVLRFLGEQTSHRSPLHFLLERTGTDVELAAGLCRRRLFTATVRSSGEQVTGDDLAKLPAKTVNVRITPKGRAYLPF